MFTLLTLTAFAIQAAAADPTNDALKADTDAFKKYLAEKHPGKKWLSGPSRIDAESIRKAYGDKVRFYFTFSATPLPPGAPLPEIIKQYQNTVEDIRKNHINLTVMIDQDQKITPFQKPEDFSRGLMPVKTDDDARLAAAAILSLTGQDRVGPAPLAAKDVTVLKNDKGWTCSTMTNFVQGSVQFDATGKCTSISKVYAGPLPPMAPPKFQK